MRLGSFEHADGAIHRRRIPSEPKLPDLPFEVDASTFLTDKQLKTITNQTLELSAKARS